MACERGTSDSFGSDGTVGGTVVSCERKRHFGDLDRLVREGMKQEWRADRSRGQVYILDEKIAIMKQLA